MKKIFIINGSPRKNGNTAAMCQKFMQGAQSAGAAVEFIHLYDYAYKGCYSCFACKLKGGASYGKCAYMDGITPLLNLVAQADGLVLASPVYFGAVTGQMRSFLERLCFPFFVYDKDYSSIAPKRFPVTCLYTMNVPEELAHKMYVRPDGHGALDMMHGFLGKLFQPPKVLCAYDTFQFSDYSRYVADCWDPQAKAQRRDQVFPAELQAAFDAGVEMARQIQAN